MATKNLTDASNVVPAKTLRSIQSNVLLDLSNILSNSFGPKGSTTCIKKENAMNVYTKDGYNILKSIYYHGIIEQSIKDDIESITRYIVTTVGDGTTSAVILSNFIFEQLNQNPKFTNYHPSMILRELNKAVNNIKKEILNNSKEASIEDYYDIAMISSDGNEEISTNIANIYKEYGSDVFIDVSISNNTDNMLKIYDGLTIENGFCDASFINNSDKSVCDIRDAHIYFFEDPIDTPEMANFLDKILYMNIFNPYENVIEDKKTGVKKAILPVIPTVIVAPHVSKDLSALMDTAISNFAQIPPATRPPLVIITGVRDMETYADIIKLCGGKSIKKYIDPKIQEDDIKNGRAPTMDTVFNWYGHAEQVVSDTVRTKFINPDLYKNDDGSYSELYKSIIKFLEDTLKKAKDEGENAGVTGSLKRRINALKGNMVEYLVGGISPSDRDAARDLVEDTVLNCRSASKYGVGHAANFEAFNAVNKLLNNNEDIDNVEFNMYNIIKNAYNDLIYKLFEMSLNSKEETIEKFNECINNHRPINLRTGLDDGSAKSSIESDMIILDSVVKIVGMMFTTNQFIVPTPAHNVYINYTE